MNNTGPVPAEASTDEMDGTVCDPTTGCCGGVDRRTFIKWTGLGAANVTAASAGLDAIAGPFKAEDMKDHFVPADKKLKPEWIKGLFAKGERTWYRGKNLETIAMPVDGVCAGRLYLAGDGRLVHWDILRARGRISWPSKSPAFRKCRAFAPGSEQVILARP